MNYKIVKPVALLVIATGLLTLSSDADAQPPVYHESNTSIRVVDNYNPITWDIPLSTELQAHIVVTCEEYNIDPRIVIGLIQVESNYNPNTIGDEGRSYGLMQIQLQWHKDRMKRLGCTDLLDPYQNITVGVDILAEMCEKYDTMEETLTAYNAGETGAYNLYFSKGIKANDYALKVIEIAESL